MPRPITQLALFLFLLGNILGGPNAYAEGTVQGLITDVRDGTPLPGVTLRLGRSSIFGGFYPLTEVSAAVSGADGRYQIAAVPNGSFVLRVEAPLPFLSLFWPNTPCRLVGICDGPGSPGNLTVSEGAIVTANAVVGPPGAVSGRVRRDDNAQPISGARVRLQWVSSGFGPNVDVTTDSNGEYLVAGLPHGNYKVEVDAGAAFIAEVFDDIPCIPSCSVVWTPVVVVSDSQRSAVDFGLGAGAAIGGMITETGGGPPAHPVELELRRIVGGSTVSAAIATRQSQGSGFAFTGLASGRYLLRTRAGGAGSSYVAEVFDNRTCIQSVCTEQEIEAGTPIELAAGQIIDNIQIEVDPGASLAGCVTDAANGAPLPGVVVVAYGDRPPSIFLPRVSHNGITGADGCYSFTHLLGSIGQFYRLRTVNQAGYVDELFADTSCLGGSCNIDQGIRTGLLFDQDIDGLNFGLSVGASISGTVRAYPGGPVIEDFQLTIVTEQGLDARSDGDNRLDFAGDGSFKTYGMSNGVYYLSALVQTGPYSGFYQLGAPRRLGSPSGNYFDGTPASIVGNKSVTDLDFALTIVKVFDSGFEE